MLIIGERINSSRKSIASAIASADKAFIQGEVHLQGEAGADYIDVNAAAFFGEEIEKLKWVIDVVQEVTELPLCIDSPDPGAIRAVLPMVNKPPMINSISLEPNRLEGILPLVTEYKAKVVGLCQSEKIMAESTAAKVDLAAQLVEKVRDAGISPEDLYIDPLVYPLSASVTSAQSTLDAIERIMQEFPGVHTTCGLTNVSHGLPARKLVNRTFLAACVLRGLDSAIMDPTDKQLYGALKAAVMIGGRDDFCLEFVDAFRAGRIE